MGLSKSIRTMAISLFLGSVIGVPAWAEQTLHVSIKTQAGTHDQPYFVVMLLDDTGRYQKTLTMIGNDSKYYNRAFAYWKRNISRTGEDIDALSSASVGNGTTVKRTVTVPDDAMAKNYTVRIDSAGYRGEKYLKTVMIKLSPDNKKKRFTGKKFLDSAWIDW